MTAPVETLKLRFELLSAATFGRGDGLPGLVDREVDHDRYGLPLLRGRTLRGLLAEEMCSLLYGLGLENNPQWSKARYRLLGDEGEMSSESGIMHVGDACLLEGLRKLIAFSVDNKQITANEVLNSLTSIRRQTAMTHLGAPEPASLRSMRVIRREAIFESVLTFDEALTDIDKSLLTATVLAWKRAGTGRNRGRGRLRAWVENEAWTLEQFKVFHREVSTQ